MKVKYELLYKNGHVDVIEQDSTEEILVSINQTILDAFSKDADGHLTFGDNSKEGYFIRMSSLDRVKINVVEGLVNE